jgi:hypothetical protein
MMSIGQYVAAAFALSCAGALAAQSVTTDTRTVARPQERTGSAVGAPRQSPETRQVQGRVGRRQNRAEAAAIVNPAGRINGRIANRVQNRLTTRIGTTTTAQTKSGDAIASAASRSTRVAPPRSR